MHGPKEIRGRDQSPAQSKSCSRIALWTRRRRRRSPRRPPHLAPLLCGGVRLPTLAARRGRGLPATSTISLAQSAAAFARQLLDVPKPVTSKPHLAQPL